MLSQRPRNSAMRPCRSSQGSGKASIATWGAEVDGIHHIRGRFWGMPRSLQFMSTGNTRNPADFIWSTMAFVLAELGK
eukprot:918190-Alexandrium_andersonii.AAC.1